MKIEVYMSADAVNSGIWRNLGLEPMFYRCPSPIAILSLGEVGIAVWIFAAQG
jgi:hypothetical protein